MRLIIVTGASRGIGSSIVDELAISNPEDKIMALARTMSIKSNHKNVSNIVVDIASMPALEKLCDSLLKNANNTVIEEVVLFNNAGVLGPVDYFDKISIDELKRTFEINTFAPMFLSQWVIKNFKQSKIKIIHISSGVARYPMPNWSAYCMSKSALDMHAQVVRAENHPNVSIVSVAPGIIDTKMQEEIRSVKDDRFVMKSKFVHYKEANKLKSPVQTAKELIALLPKIHELDVVCSL